VAVQLRAVEVERPLAPRPDRHHCLEVGQPASCYLTEREPRRKRQFTEFSERLKQGSL
jgi:hypothetical protein